jgi:menaquinone-dependent protoporphyrinogen oxidase
MANIAILYATREGHTRRIAEHAAEIARAQGFVPVVCDVADIEEPFALGGFDAALIAASVHAGRHEREMVQFVRRHRAQLEQIPAAFLSVSLTETTVEDASKPDDARARSHADVQRMLEEFYTNSGWRPKYAKPVAGALLYMHYGILLRFVMRRIAKKAGGPTDTSRDYDFTDWAALESFVKHFLQESTQQAAAIGLAAP